MAKTKEATAERVRVRRTPADGYRDKLAVRDQDPEFVYRWVNDVPGRIDALKERGYEVVKQDLEVGQSTVDRGTRTGSVPTLQAGNGIVAVLMRIPRAWYNEDQAAKAEENNATEAAMRVKAKSESDYGSLTITRK